MSDRDNPAARRTRLRPATSGVLVVDKPLGLSSMGAVSRVRRKAGGARTGHAGTLDPLATGVLVMALGRATKIIDRLMGTDKRYRTTIDLSAFTSTDDREGEREEIAVAGPPDAAAVAAALREFVGVIEQRPPAFSAVKIDGQRAYKLARRGEPREIPARAVETYGVVLAAYDWPLAEVEIHCAKGFYVRSLARDLGRRLGTGGHCLSIVRTASGPFTLQMATPLEDVPEPLVETDLIPIETALAMVSSPTPGP